MLQEIVETLASSRDALQLGLYSMATATILFSSALYFAEAGELEYDEARGIYFRTPEQFQSIPHTFWYLVGCVLYLSLDSCLRLAWEPRVWPHSSDQALEQGTN